MLLVLTGSGITVSKNAADWRNDEFGGAKPALNHLGHRNVIKGGS